MSARLGLNQMPNVSWKGKTFSQIVSCVKKNTNTSESTESFARARPIKHYRRELAISGDGTSSSLHTSRRTSVTIDAINAPGGTLVHSATCGGDSCVGIPQTVDFVLTENFSERPCHPDSTADDFTLDFSQAANARRRVRSSSGVIKRSVRPGTTNDMYKTSNAQYLESRGLTFKQNQYNFVKEGSKSVVPGDVMSMNNIYVGAAMSNYPKLLISAAKGNNSFSYVWIDGNTYTITFDDDYYDATEFTAFVQKKMRANLTYLLDTDGAYYYLIEMYYDSYYQRFTINCRIVTSTMVSSYSVPSSASWTLTDTTGIVPNVVISGEFCKVVGVSAGTYPSTLVGSQSSTYSEDQATYGYSSQIRPAYKPIYYKPNNINYAQQGGVTASERMARLKYNTITTAASSFRSAFGGQTASAYAYHVAPTGTLMTLKSKLGYPNKRVPVISKYGCSTNSDGGVPCSYSQ